MAPLDLDPLRAAREEAWQALGSVAHYCDLARGHLEIADDPVAVYDLMAARQHFLIAIEAFKVIRLAMLERGKVAA